MKRFLLVLFIAAMPVWGADPSSIAGWERIESMVETGAITREAAQQEKVRGQLRHLEARKEAQRGLASVHPDLQPHKLKHLKFEPLIIYLD